MAFDTRPAVPSRSAEVFERIVELRRHFHQHPELAHEEVQTARTIMAELDRLGIDYDYGGKGGGVVGRLIGAAPGPTIALRAEMDALPCAERTGLPFASAVPDRRHACGHDAHMAIVLGAAALLAKSPPPGTVMFVFQPAEEHGNGAQVIVETGALRGVDGIFAGHVSRQYRVSEIMVAAGAITAHSDRFRIEVHGKSGHGARPHEAVDAVMIAGLLITAVQTLVSRHVNPVFPSVVTIGSMHAGSAANIIAERAVLEGIIRATEPGTREQIIRGLHRTAKAIGELHDTEIQLELGESCPAVVNTPREVAIARSAAHDIVGAGGIVMQDHVSMGAEDFSYYLRDTPGCYVRFGCRSDGEYTPLHSPLFDLDERVLEVGARYFERLARHALTEYGA